MENIKVTKNEDVRKSEQYKTFPEAGFGVWGPEVRENNPDKLHTAIMARIRHISGRIDSYLPYPPGGENQYKVDQTIAHDLENSFDELAQLYLKIIKENHKAIYPLDKNTGSYPYDTIKDIDSKFEEIHDLVLKAEEPLFDEKNNRIIDKSLGEIGGNGLFREATEEEKNTLHQKGIDMLKEAILKIKSLESQLEELKNISENSIE